MSERSVNVLDGSTFVVSDRLGDVRANEGREHGFFSSDTRFIARWFLRVAPTRCSCSASTRARTSTCGSS